MPIECGEGEELIDGECQVILTEEDEEDTAPDEEESGDTGGDVDIWRWQF